MTKPIFEPTPQRQVSALRFDKNQLFRRPAPRSDAADTDLPWGYRYASNTQTVPGDGTITPIDFSQTGTAHRAVSDTGDLELEDDIGSGEYGFDLHTSGFWTLRIALYWDDDPGYGYVIINTDPTEPFDGVSSRFLPRGSPISFTMTWPYPDRAFGPVFPYFAQYSGVDKDIFGATFTAVYLGSYAGSPILVN